MKQLRWFWLLGLLVTGLVQAEEPEGFADYVQELKAAAAEAGIGEETIAEAFAEVRFYERAVSADRTQPERTITLESYLPRAVPDWKVAQGVEKWREHRDLLDEVAAEFGVQPRFIVALWGIETNYGGYTGNFRIISALTTMAFEGRRESFFRDQLMQALQIIDEGHIEPADMRGSWAGAMGQTQFMPSSFLSYAVDFDQDGQIDIWHSFPDVFASAANYLNQSGWDDSKTWGRQVTIPDDFDADLAGMEHKRSLAEWQELGVRRYDGTDLPIRDIQAAIIMPDGPRGRVYLAYQNWEVLLRWNRSHYFAVAVGHLADRLQMARDW